ncbi:MAG: single- stranded DNA-binding family protein [Conexivisphaera sp.]
MSQAEGVLRTGPVRSSGYALKLRRVVNAALRQRIKEGILNATQVNDELTRINKVLYSYIVERYQVPKEAVVSLVVKYSIRDGRFAVEDVQVDIYERDEILSNNITEGVRKELSSRATQ